MENKLVISQAKKNFRNYRIITEFTAGIALTGKEIKSVRSHQISLEESYVRNFGGELYLVNLHIASYQSLSSDTRRKRKLLLHKNEIQKIIRGLKVKHYGLVPLQVFISQKGWAKVEIALAQRLRQYQIKEKNREKEINKKIKSEDFW
ncbi:MAG: SsrA-binding protein [Candidatus Moeniiplasma glomeromycotorum]|nr:SsrA-binding protein [Candidatus Moeniiplasma glomeromycotorum]MCE8167135.1 SsrA-binding protein [Candidatus Moeniiplasma glomeromycotorum]MCE8168853.1 SsrA-binding protein [Candidatus Moeniiplasma glomeromycotorum]